MSTNNFYTQRDFPLYAYSDSNFYGKNCENCGTCFYGKDAENDVFPDCGEQLSGFFFDDIVQQVFADDIKNRLDDINSELFFFSIEIRSGYFTDLQFYVDLTQDAQQAGFTETGAQLLDNDCAHIYFDCCRSVAIRRYESEKKKVNRILEELASEYGFEKLKCIGVFSNGEAFYSVA